MDSITDLTWTGYAGTPALASSNLPSGQEFFTLISAQLRNQDPLEPVDESQYLGQIAQFAQLEQTTMTNSMLQTMALLQENLAAMQQMTEAVQLIGQRVEYTDPETGEPASGEVKAVRVEDGLVVLDVDGTHVPFTRLTAIVGENTDG